MSQGNYFQINRKLLTHPLWIAEAFTKGQAWVDLIGTANHSPGYFFKRGVRIDIERGQTGVSIESLVKRWKWSKGKVSRFLNFLEKESMIEQKRGNQTTVITVCNYNTYQSDNTNGGKPSSKADSKPSDTPNGKPSSKQTIKINNKQKELKRKKKNISGFSEAFTRWWLIYPMRNGRKRGKQKAATLFDKIDSTLWSDLKKATENYTQETAQEFVKDPERFLLNKFWLDFVKSPDKYSKQKTSGQPEKVRSFAEIAAEMPEEIDFFGRKEAKNKTMINVNENKRIEYE